MPRRSRRNAGFATLLLYVLFMGALLATLGRSMYQAWRPERRAGSEVAGSTAPQGGAQAMRSPGTAGTAGRGERAAPAGRDDANAAGHEIPAHPVPGEPAPIPADPPAGVPHPADAPPPTLSDAVGELRARNLLLPVDRVAVEDLRQTFEEARGERRHEAMDILAPRGTPVFAVEDGTIEKLFESERGGLTVYQFDATRRFAYYYAHLDRYAPGLEEEQRVRRGDPIGFVGTTGNAAPDTPHLHFAVFVLTPDKQWWKGEAIDPFLVWRTPEENPPHSRAR